MHSHKVIEHFPKSMERFSDQKCDKQKNLEPHSDLIRMGIALELRKSINSIEGYKNSHANNNSDFLRTGAPSFDAALFGGIALGKITELRPDAYLSEISMLGFAIALAGTLLQKRTGDFVVVNDAYFTQEWGEIYAAGLQGFGILPHRILLINPQSRDHFQSCMREVSSTTGLGAVLGLVSAKSGFDLTAARKLQFAASQGGAPCLLASAYRAQGLCCAHLRLKIGPRQSRLPDWAWATHENALAPLGAERWGIDIEKSRQGAIGHFELEFSNETYNLCEPPILANRSDEFQIWPKSA